MLKAYVSRDTAKPVVLVKPVSEDAVFNCPYSPEADGLVDRNAKVDVAMFLRSFQNARNTIVPSRKRPLHYCWHCSMLRST